MPSRKKAKGKARKAAKEAEAAKAKEQESQAQAQASSKQMQEGSLEAQLQRLMISSSSSKKCLHGCHALSPSDQKICGEFIDSFVAAYTSRDDVAQSFLTAYYATKDEYADVYATKIEPIISAHLSTGTRCILEGDNDAAQLHASFACYFGEWIAVCLHKTTAAINWGKVIELYDADDHTLVSFYRNRIPCSCLDEKHKEVKSVKKMGLCYNNNCSQPGKKVERSKMFSCIRCYNSNYCSIECQKADWKRHKMFCNAIAEKKAARSVLSNHND